MSNLIDYVKQYGHLSYEDYPLSELDKFVFNELTYLSLDKLCEGLDQTDQLICLADYKEVFQEKKKDLEPTFIRTEGRLELIDFVLQAPRYNSLMLSHYIDDYSTEYEKQFAAVTFTIEALNYRQVVFRGTDATVIGWKEDFNMTFMSEIPAQRSAKNYLRVVLAESDTPVVVSGHSKGGNLALYASAFIGEDLQDKISQVYCLDAPGLHRAPIQKEGFQSIKNRIIAIQPKDSMIGVMLDKETQARVVEAQYFGIAQHNMLNWKVEEDYFIEVDEPSILSTAFADTCRQWIIDLSPRELKIVFDSIFGLFLDNGIESLDEIIENPTKHLGSLVIALRDMPSDKRNLVVRSFGHMFSIFTEAASSYVRENLTTRLDEKILDEDNIPSEGISTSEEPSTAPDWLQSLATIVKDFAAKADASLLPKPSFLSSETAEAKENVTAERIETIVEEIKTDFEEIPTIVPSRLERLANFAESFLPDLIKNENDKNE